MTFLFDENLPPAVAIALRDLGQPVTSVQIMGLCGTKDEALLPIVAAEQACLVTGDPAMLRNEGRVAQFRVLGVSAFILRDGMVPGIEKARIVFRCWPEMLRRASLPGPAFFADLHATGPAVREARPGWRMR